jgi:hypothetical protein
MIALREMLQEREQYYLDMLEALPVAIYTTDAAGKITYTPTLRKSGKPPCQSPSRRFCFIHDPLWIPGRRIAPRPD